MQNEVIFSLFEVNMNENDGNKVVKKLLKP